MRTSYLIKQISEQLTKLLLNKNKDYGDSATQGEAIFASKMNKDKMTAKQFGLCCRIDDKLYRIKNKGITDKTEDSLWDLAGYFILLLTTLKQQKNNV
tara:strand:- start:1456 stop:1749 length:294 start_codon:yes stop_codon:yes gene_type:complete